MRDGRSSRASTAMTVTLAALGFAFFSTVLVETNGHAQYPGRAGNDNSWDMWGSDGAELAPPKEIESRWTLRMARHWTFMHDGIPVKYQNQKNPFEPGAAVTQEGRVLFQENCARCHGVRGQGDGEEGLSLRPPPALLDRFVESPVAADEYLLWTITDGGEIYNTEMPAFEDTFGREQIWKLITYMRAGFPTE